MPNPVDIVEVLPGFPCLLASRLHCAGKRLPGAVCPRQKLGVPLAHMTDTKGEDKTVEINVAPGVDRFKQVLCRNCAPTFPVAQLGQGLLVPSLQREDLGRGSNQLILIKRIDLLVPKPFNVKGVTGNEVLQFFRRLRRTDQATRTAAYSILAACLFVLLPDSMTVADWTTDWKNVRLRV